MQILVLSSKFPYPLKDGGAIATFQIFSGLSKLSDNIHLLSFNTTKHFVIQHDIPDDKFPKDTYTLVSINTKPSVVGALKNLFFSKKPYILNRFRHKKYAEKLRALITSFKFDIIQVEGLYMLQYIDEIRKYSSAKIAYRAHNLEHQIWEQLSINTSNLLKKLYLKILSRRIYKYELFCLDKYDLLIPIANEDAEFYKNIGSQTPLKVVPTGFNFTQEQFLKPTSNISRLFFIGSLDWRPNQEGLIWFLENCWGRLREEYQDVELHIAGRNAPDWLLNKVKLPGVVFHGEVESSVEFMKDKDIMIVPLLSGGGMRIKIIEAFVYSKAVVATSVAAKGTNSVHGTHILVADQPNKFVEEIMRLISNRSLFITQVERANMLARSKFNNAIIIEKLFKFYSAKLQKFNK